MPTIVSCPDCGGKLRISAEPGPRKRIKCPKCAAVFMPGAPEEAEEIKNVAPAPRKRSRGEIDEPDEEERAEARRERQRRSQEDDDEEDRPARCKRASSSSREEEEDYEEDRPVRRKKRKKKKGISTGLLIGLIGGGVAILIGIGVVLLVLFGGSAYSRHEAALRESIGMLNELAAALESVKDPASARAAATRINSVCDRMEAMARRIKSLPKLTTEEDRKLQDAFKGELDAAVQRGRLAGRPAGLNSRGDPTFVAALRRLQSMQNLLR